MFYYGYEIEKCCGRHITSECDLSFTEAAGPLHNEQVNTPTELWVVREPFLQNPSSQTSFGDIQVF